MRNDDRTIKSVKQYLKKGGYRSGADKGMIGLCERLRALDREWQAVVGPVFAERSCIARAEMQEEKLHILIHTSDTSAGMSMRFSRIKIEKTLSRFLRVPSVSVEIKSGRIYRNEQGGRKKPLPAYRRRRPIYISEEEVLKEAADLCESEEMSEIAKKLAAIKLLAKKRAARRRD
jgi:hypothetical protein